MPSGETVGAAVAIGLVSLVLILALGRWLPRIPGVLVAVVVAIVASSAFSLGRPRCLAGGHAAQRAPPVHVPQSRLGFSAAVRRRSRDRLGRADRHDLDGFVVRRPHRQEVDGSGEMIGIGAANVAAGFFQGFPVSTSGSRTAVAEQSGAKTQATGVVGAAAIVLMLVFVPGLLRNLPQPTLAAVVIAASRVSCGYTGNDPAVAPATGRVRCCR